MRDRSTTSRTHHRGAAGDWPGQPAPGEPAAESGADIDLELERLRAELETAQTQTAEHLASLQRTAADFANFRRRTSEDRERELGLASESLLRKLLVVADDFDRALETMPADLRGIGWIEGVVLLDRKLRQLLESEGVTPIEAIGRPFDPREHEAILSVPATGRPDGEIVAEVQRGYRVRDRVLRPAQVAVADGGATAPGDTTSYSN
jgi:molecular chaperone GrpE